MLSLFSHSYLWLHFNDTAFLRIVLIQVNGLKINCFSFFPKMGKIALQIRDWHFSLKPNFTSPHLCTLERHLKMFSFLYLLANVECYSVFQGFSKAKSANGGSILRSSQFLILPQLPQKIKLLQKWSKLTQK